MTLWTNAAGEAAEASNLNDLETRIKAAVGGFSQHTWTQKTAAAALSAANVNVLQQGIGPAVSVWDTQADPAAVTDWGPIINTLYQNGARRLLFRRVGGVNTKYYCSTPIAPGLVAGGTIRQPLMLEGEVGWTWQEFVNSQVVKPSASLVWNGSNTESLIKRQNTQTFTCRDLGLEFANGYTGRLIRNAPDNGGVTSDAAYSPVLERCYIGPENPAAANEASADGLVSLIKDVESKFLFCLFQGGQYAVRGTESTHNPSFSNDAEFFGCTFNAQAVAPFMNVGTNWRVHGGVIELTTPFGAASGPSQLMDTDSVNTGGDPSIELNSVTFWDATNPSFYLLHSKTGRPIHITVRGGAMQTHARASLLGGGSLTVDGLRLFSASSDFDIDLGSAATDYKRVRLRNLETFITRTVVITNRDGHDVTLDNVGSASSRKVSLRQAAIEVGGQSKSQAGNEPPTIGTLGAGVSSAGIVGSSSDALLMFYFVTNAIVAANTEIATITFNTALPYNKAFGELLDGSLVIPILQPIHIDMTSAGVHSSAGEAGRACMEAKIVSNDRTKFKLVNGVAIPASKVLAFAVSTKVLS